MRGAAHAADTDGATGPSPHWPGCLLAATVAALAAGPAAAQNQSALIAAGIGACLDQAIGHGPATDALTAAGFTYVEGRREVLVYAAADGTVTTLVERLKPSPRCAIGGSGLPVAGHLDLAAAVLQDKTGIVTPPEQLFETSVGWFLPTSSGNVVTIMVGAGRTTFGYEGPIVIIGGTGGNR